MQKEIVILAKSIKNGKYCIAGKDVETKEWIRPVPTEDGKELSGEQSKSYFVDNNGNPVGYPCKPLQKVRINFLKHVPLPYQAENYLIDDSKWMQNYKINNHELNQYLDKPQVLWNTSDHIKSTDLNRYNPNGNSLYLIQANNINLLCTYNNNSKNRRISFDYNGNKYDLRCTDPEFDKIIGSGNNKQIDSAILCISLAAPFEHNSYPSEIRHYKLVAAIYL